MINFFKSIFRKRKPAFETRDITLTDNSIVVALTLTKGQVTDVVVISPGINIDYDYMISLFENAAKNLRITQKYVENPETEKLLNQAKRIIQQ